MKFVWSKFESRLSLLFLVVGLAGLAYTYSRPADFHLTLEMASSVPSTAQVFYDIGNGFNETDSVKVPLTSRSLNSFQSFSFPLPKRTIFQLRLDPFTTAGQVIVRNVAIKKRDTVIAAFPASTIKGYNQIATRSEHGQDVQFATVPGANDPGLIFSLAAPLRLRWAFTPGQIQKLSIFYAGLALLFVLALISKRMILALLEKPVGVITRINARFDQMARSFPEDSFLEMDALTIWVYLGLAVLFVGACVLDLNGSSAGMYHIYGDGPQAKVLIGSPKGIRVDEWSYVTPDVLNQYFRADRFAFNDSVLGDHNIALTGNIPVKHISTLFRPQFWSFFVLPAGYAFAVYWQFKSLLLVAGVFTFLLLITRSSFWALAGALWYLFSPFTQWSFSWASALPEMIGCLCLAVVCFCYLTTGRNRMWLAVAAAGLAWSAINFFMCAYPPHLIPLAWTGLLVAGAWCVANRKSIFSGKELPARVLALAAAVAIIAAVGLDVYRDLRPAIAAVADTVYPGHRILPGGTLPIWDLFSQLLPWTETENQFPAALGNICEGSGFLWLAPFTLFCLPKLELSSFQKAALVALWICFIALFCWCVYPVPAVFGAITGLNRCTGARCMPALGLANIGIVSLTMARYKGAVLWTELQLGVLMVGVALFVSIFWATNEHLGKFFGKPELVAGAFLAAFLSMLVIAGKGRQLALWLIVSQALVFGTVNPVEVGIPEFTQSAFHRFVEAHRELVRSKWLVYSDTPIRSGFIAEAGCEVYTGTRYIPDVDHFALFAARGLDLNVFNRLGYLDAHPIALGQPTRFIQQSPVVVEWDVAPNDPILKQLGIGYVAFDTKPQPGLIDGLTPVSTTPIDNFWIYKLSDSSVQ